MARAPIKEQNRFGPAQSRARVFSAFVQPRVDNKTGEAFGKAADVLGSAAEFQAQREIEQAETERQQGLEDFVAGRIRDGQMIRDGELQPIQSEYYMAGVEMGQGRRHGRNARVAFEQWKAANPRPDFDAEPGEDGVDPYEAWISEGLAQAQSEAGIDPDNMTELEMSEYANVLNQVRQRDVEEQLSHINSSVLRNAQENFGSDIMGLSSEYEGDPEGLYGELASRLRVAVDVDGIIDRNAGREMILQSVINRANETGDVSLLENLPDVPFLTPELKAQRNQAVSTINSNLEAARTERAAEFLTANDDMVADGRFEAAMSQVEELFGQGLITDDQRRTQRRYIRNQRDQVARRAEDNSSTRVRQAREGLVVQGAVHSMLDGSFRSFDNIYEDDDGDLRSVSYFDDRVWAGVEARVAQQNPDDPQAQLHELARIARENQTPAPAVENLVSGISNQFSIETVAEMSPDDPQMQQLAVIMSLEESALDLHATGEDIEFINNVRAIYSQASMNEEGQRASLHQAVSLVARAKNRPEPLDLQVSTELDEVLSGTGGMFGFGMTASEAANATQVRQDLQQAYRLMTRAGMPEHRRRQRIQEMRDHNYVKANGAYVRRLRGRTAQESAVLFESAINAYASRFDMDASELSLFETRDGAYVIVDRDGMPLDTSALPEGAGRAAFLTPQDIERSFTETLDPEEDFNAGLRRLEERRAGYLRRGSDREYGDHDGRSEHIRRFIPGN